ncbi:hypothetical protein CEK26_003783 [Fusarium fujikuroi]|nr:hypothetical protein CEK26_003783 [Fusarium fujikuroi]
MISNGKCVAIRPLQCPEKPRYCDATYTWVPKGPPKCPNGLIWGRYHRVSRRPAKCPEGYTRVGPTKEGFVFNVMSQGCYTDAQPKCSEGLSFDGTKCASPRSPDCTREGTKYDPQTQLVSPQYLAVLRAPNDECALRASPQCSDGTGLMIPVLLSGDLSARATSR